MKRTTLAIITAASALTVLSNNALACTHTNMKQCLSCNSGHCDKEGSSFSDFNDCIDFTITNCENQYLPMAGSPLTNFQKSQVKQIKAMSRRFRRSAKLKFSRRR